MSRLARLLCAAFASAVCGLAAAAQPARAAQAEGVFSIGIPRAEEAAPVQPAVPDAAQLQAVWDLGAAGNLASAGRLLASLEADHPDWRPPARLTTYLAAARREADVRSALAARDWAGALAKLPATGARACEAPFDLWARAEATEGLGQQADLRAFYVRTLGNCADPELAAAMAGRALQVLDADGLAAIAALASLRHSEDAGVRVAHGRILRAEARLRFDAAAGQGDLAGAARVADASDDPVLLAKAGWVFLEGGAAGAADYFSRALALGGDEDARRGYVMATLAAGDISSARGAIAKAGNPAALAGLSARADLAEAAARRAAGDWAGAVALAASARSETALAGEADALTGGALLDASGAAYAAADFIEARRLAERAAAYPATRRAALMRAAWTDLQLGEADAAGAAFSRLYVEMPDTESAEGYALAAARTGQLGAAAALARTLGGPLGAKVDAQYAEAAFSEGSYLTARAYAPDTYEALEGMEGPWYRQAVSFRQQSGTAGENRLTGGVATTSAGFARGPNTFEAGVAFYTLDPGRGAASGLAPARETFAAPYAAWSREGETRLAARIGLLPAGADADPVVVGELAVSRQAGGGQVEARAFKRPVTDSVLSFAGQPDAGGETHGPASATGAQVRARMPAGEHYAVQADASAAEIDGDNLAGNSVVSAGVSASRAIARDGFAYLVTGPFYQFQAYDRNTNFFAPGHGGYFSPQSFHRAGWSANLQTDPLERWILKADAALAYESIEEDAARANPLQPGPQPLLGGGRSAGAAGALELAAARRLSPQLILAARFAATASQAYEDVRVGIALTWVPGGRVGLARTDLPPDPFSPAAWIQS